MTRPSALLVGFLFLAGSLPSQTGPGIGGHSPGELWSAIGRGLPCTTSDSTGLFMTRRAPVKVCDADHGVALAFLRDTLYLVTVRS